MNVEATIEWIEALAANDYNQTENKMCTGYDWHMDWSDTKETNGFCCLGVRRFLDRPDLPPADQEYGPEWAREEPEGWERVEFGLKNKGMGVLMELNDGGATFPEIARKILERPCFYFEAELAEEIKDYFWDTK